MNEIININDIQTRILAIRGQQVMLDRDLAELYGVSTAALNQAVKRNRERFPETFVFQMDEDEFMNWKSQIVISNSERMGLRKRPFVFTEHGLTMMAALLRSSVAIKASVEIVNAFVAMRHFLVDTAGILQRIGAIEIKQLKTDERVATVFDALARGNLLPSGILPPNSEYDAMRFVTRIVESAKKEIVLIDPYSDAQTLDVLAKKRADVSVRLLCKNRGQPTANEIAKFNRQYGGLSVEYSDAFHDRFLIVDGIEMHNLGSSVNSLGRRVTSYTTRDSKEISKVLALLPRS